MAITVERESTRKGMVRVISGVVLVIALFVATFILFFTEPPQIEVLAPPEVQTITQISEINLDPDTIIDSPEYEALEGYVLPPEPGDFGRSNPFTRF